MKKMSEHFGRTVSQGPYIGGGHMMGGGFARSFSVHRYLLGEGAPDDKCWSKATLKKRFYGQ